MIGKLAVDVTAVVLLSLRVDSFQLPAAAQGEAVAVGGKPGGGRIGRVDDKQD